MKIMLYSIAVVIIIFGCSTPKITEAETIPEIGDVFYEYNQ